MVRILFICHGNICRSPMAHFYMAKILKKRKLEGLVAVDSAAAHTDELGNPPYYATREILIRKGIPLLEHRATLLTKQDGERYDYLVCMDEYNARDVKRIVGEKNSKKVSLLLSFAGEARSVADPWYTRDFEKTYEDVALGCEALLEEVVRKSEGKV